MISLVVAAALNGVIGVEGDLPWRLPDDLKRFKQITLGKPVIMGRRTYESIGFPLPGRQNIVMTRDQQFAAEGCDVVHSPEQALATAASDEVMIIGGGAIYAMFLERADKVCLTEVHAEIDGDTYFPALPDAEWREAAREHHPADERHAYAFDFVIYERR